MIYGCVHSLIFTATGEALCVRWCLGKETGCKGIKKQGNKEYCALGANWLAHRCSVIVSLEPFRVCGKPHQKRDCEKADFS